MAYPLIIIGAGASHDYIHDNQEDPLVSEYKPPLADNLFNRYFNDYINEFPEMGQLPGSIINAVKNKQGLEQFLSGIEKRQSNNPDRRKELIAFRFYLQRLFKVISDKYGGNSLSNFHGLIGEIKDHFAQACIVNFNYDLLLEQALGIGESIDSYVEGQIKIIKVHGACDWIHPFRSPYRKSDKDIRKSYLYFLENTDLFYKIDSNPNKAFYVRNNLFNTNYMEKINDGTIYFLYPAILLPLPDKESFVCPEKHELELEKALKLVDRILVIGWKAQDVHLIKIMEEEIEQPVFITIVAGKKDEIKEIRNRFNGLNVIKENSCVGFSNFVGSEVCDEFLNDEYTPKSLT